MKHAKVDNPKTLAERVQSFAAALPETAPEGVGDMLILAEFPARLLGKDIISRGVSRRVRDNKVAELSPEEARDLVARLTCPDNFIPAAVQKVVELKKDLRYLHLGVEFGGPRDKAARFGLVWPIEPKEHKQVNQKA